MSSASTRTFDRLLEIEDRARSLQVDVYKHREDLWKGCAPNDLIEIFEPGVGLRRLGYTTESVSRLGEQWINGVRSEVAGMIDHEQKLVTISERFLNSTKRFTAAHELGHAVLHPDGPPMHRDFPLERAGVVRDRREVEANRFASAYLMPRKLVEEDFSERFALKAFELTDATAFALCGTKSDIALRMFRSPRQVSLCLAGTGHFNGRHFRPLSERFKVSTDAMAIRLEELRIAKPR